MITQWYHKLTRSRRLNIPGAVRTGLVCIAFSLVSLLSFSQQGYLFRGKVVDHATGQGIPDANLKILGSNAGCVSGKNGEFTFISGKLPVYMMVSHIGYESRRIWISEVSHFLTITMESSVRLLKEVEVRGTHAPVVFFEDKKFSVLDYEVCGGNVFLLVYRFRQNRSEVLCKAENGDTLGRSGFLPFRAVSLFLDCLGRMHVLSTDSAYELMSENENIHLYSPVDINRFRIVLSNCLASTEYYLYFRQESPDHQIVDFYQINRQTRARRLLSSTADELKLKMLRRNGGDYRLLVLSRIPNDRKEFEEYSWIRKILYTSNHTTLKKTGKSISLFNTSEQTISSYSQGGEFQSELKMLVSQVNDGKWTADFYIDELSGTPYTSFLRNGLLTLYRIDLNTGDLRRVITAEHTFPQKIRIQNRCMYYLYSAPGSWENKRLYAQKI